MGPSVPSSSPKGGNEIIVYGENVWVILCLAIFRLACPFLRLLPSLPPLLVHALICDLFWCFREEGKYVLPFFWPLLILNVVAVAGTEEGTSQRLE
ncbi:hypothetical protein Tco_0000869 [Tanacetum coccineum]